jgi:hypothetical protein
MRQRFFCAQRQQLQIQLLERPRFVTLLISSVVTAPCTWRATYRHLGGATGIFLVLIVIDKPFACDEGDYHAAFAKGNKAQIVVAK